MLAAVDKLTKLIVGDRVQSRERAERDDDECEWLLWRAQIACCMGCMHATTTASHAY